MKVHRCLMLALAGLTLGLAWTAWAQDPSAAAELALDPTTLALVELVKGGGLPAVLAVLGWLVGRGGGITLRIRLHDDDRRLIEGLRPPPGEGR